MSKDRWYQIKALEAMLDTPQDKNPVVVLPTGSGKTRVIKRYTEEFDGKILVLSHVKEILQQNFESIPGAGLWSAGLGVKHQERVTVAGIHSVYRDPSRFKGVKRVIIDECHMVGDAGMYREVLKYLNAPCIGLTATPYRLNGGYIYGQDESLFSHVCYNVPVNKLQEQGYLAELDFYGAFNEEFKTDGIRVQGGDFSLSDMSLAYNRSAITNKIVDNLSIYIDTHKHWLIFGIDIKHAEEIAETLAWAGVSAAAVHSKSPRDEAIQDFKAGRIQALVNVNILTTGFDYPEVDLLVPMRMTNSPVLHVQMLGRGLRIAPGKTICTVKDFAGNAKRLGMIDEVEVAGRGKRGNGGSAFLKTCPECEQLVHPSVRVCTCGYKFPFRHNLSSKAYTPSKKWHPITGVHYHLHKKPGKPNSVRITYISGVRTFTDWVFLEHTGWAGKKSRYWLSRRWLDKATTPKTSQELIARSSQILKPTQIYVKEGGKYPEILDTRFEK